MHSCAELSGGCGIDQWRLRVRVRYDAAAERHLSADLADLAAIATTRREIAVARTPAAISLTASRPETDAEAEPRGRKSKRADRSPVSRGLGSSTMRESEQQATIAAISYNSEGRGLTQAESRVRRSHRP